VTPSSAESLEILRDAGPEPVVTSTMVMITGGAQPAVIDDQRRTRSQPASTGQQFAV